MLPYYIALVPEIKDFDLAELMRVAGALQKQATRDFGPVWEVSALVSPFASLDDVPIGYWPIIIKEDIGFAGAAGIHLDKDSQPFSLVQFSAQWSLTASHECLEMLADPFGNRLIAGDSIKKGQGRVEYLVEVSDPSEDAKFAYTVNGVLVSDFYTPHYFDPKASAGVQYSFSGAIKEPRQVLPGGYLSWHEPVSDHWFQAQFFGAKIKIADLGKIDASAQSLRAEIDRRTFDQAHAAPPLPKAARGAALRGAALSAAGEAAGKLVQASTNSKAQTWRQQIAALEKSARLKP